MEDPALLLTRPEAQASAFAALIKERAAKPIKIVISPLLRIEPTLPRTLPRADRLIFTSVNAVAQFAALSSPEGRVAYCVGDRSADAARAVGFDAISAGGNAESLIRLLRSSAPTGALLHPTGRHTRGDIAARLRQSGLDAREIVVYDQIAQPLSPAGVALVRSDLPVVVPLFSPRTATLFADATPPAPNLSVICMSEAVHKALGSGFDDVHILDAPTGQNMLSAVLGGLLGGLSP